MTIAYRYLQDYPAIIGERHEIIYKDNVIVSENPTFYNIKEIGPANRLGGFLVIKRSIFGDFNFTPRLINEEEGDFYSKFISKSKIYQIPVKAYEHHNRSITSNKLFDYLLPFKKNGYILSLFSSISNGYLVGYLTWQSNYILSIIVSVVFYILCFTLPRYSLLVFPILLFNGVSRFRGSCLTALFFPYKLIMYLFVIHKRYKYTYIVDNKTNKVGYY